MGLRAVILTLLAGLACGAGAQTLKQPSGTGQALAKAQGLLRQLSQERAQLQAEKVELLDKITALEEENAALRPRARLAEQRGQELESLRVSGARLQESLRDAGRARKDSAARYAQLEARFVELETDNLRLAQGVAERDKWIQQYAKANDEIVRESEALLEKLRSPGLWQTLVKQEPFTGIGQVADETAIHEFSFRLEDLAVTPFDPASSCQTARTP